MSYHHTSRILFWGLGALTLGVLSTHGQVLHTETHTFDTFAGQPSLAIPDGDLLGIPDSRNITSDISSLSRVEVTLNISGGFIGDLYAYLRHGSGFSILLNRLGRSSEQPFGYDDPALSIRLADNAPNGNVHFYRNVLTPAPGQSLAGTWAPDGRKIPPIAEADLFSVTPSTAGFDGFAGIDPDGTWTLFLADVSGGIQHQLDAWSLQLTGVPEPKPFAVLTSCLLLASVAHQRWLRRR